MNKQNIIISLLLSLLIVSIGVLVLNGTCEKRPDILIIKEYQSMNFLYDCNQSTLEYYIDGLPGVASFINPDELPKFVDYLKRIGKVEDWRK